jgi:hypothetical protein
LLAAVLVDVPATVCANAVVTNVAATAIANMPKSPAPRARSFLILLFCEPLKFILDQAGMKPLYPNRSTAPQSNQCYLWRLLFFASSMSFFASSRFLVFFELDC